MATVGPGPYFVDVIYVAGKQWHVARVSSRVSKRVAFEDAADILQTGLTMGSVRYDVRGVTVDRMDRPRTKRKRSFYD
jgi:hypothetical protein